jgi:hypothetical protein
MSRFTLSKPILTEEVIHQVASPQRASPRRSARAIPDEDDEPEPVAVTEMQSQPNNNNLESDSGSDSRSASDNDAEPVTVQAQPVQAHAPVVRKIRNEEDFWNYIERMAWRDRSEDPNFSVAQKKQNYRALSIPDQEAFADYLTHVVNAMDERMQIANYYGNITDVNERKAICSHIVGRGSIFYAMTMEDPGFASYLVPETPDHREYHDMMELIRI